MTTVGFAGLGRMGAPMAISLARAGFPLVLSQSREVEAAGFGRRDMASMLNYRRTLR